MEFTPDALSPYELNQLILRMMKEQIRQTVLQNITLVGDIQECKKWKRCGMSFKVCYEDNTFECKVWEHNCKLSINEIMQLQNKHCHIIGNVAVDFFQHHRFVFNVTDIHKHEDVSTKVSLMKNKLESLELHMHKKTVDWNNVKTIGIISKKHTQGFQDFTEQFHVIPLEIRDISLEGESTSEECIRMIEDLQKTDVDVILILRGGGSTIDISNAFDNIELFKKMRESTVPVLTAIGHEQDKEDKLLITTVSDVDYPTPSSAAFQLTEHLMKPIQDNIQYLLQDVESCFFRKLEASLCKYYDMLEIHIQRHCDQICSKKIINTDDIQDVIIQINDVFYVIQEVKQVDIHIPKDFNDTKKKLIDCIVTRDIKGIEQETNHLNVNCTQFIEKIIKLQKLKEKIQVCSETYSIDLNMIEHEICDYRLMTMINIKETCLWILNELKSKDRDRIQNARILFERYKKMS